MSVREKPSITTVVGSATSQFVSGALGGEKSTTAVGTVGNIVGAAIPGVGTSRAIADIWDGVTKAASAKSGADRIAALSQAAFGVVALLPGIGGLGKAATVATEGAKKAATEVGQQVAKKGFKAAALHLSSAAATAAKQTVTSKAFKKELAAAGERAYIKAVDVLKARLLDAASKGKDVVEAHEHESFSEARDAMGKALDVLQPGKGLNFRGWQTLLGADADGKPHAVGKHLSEPDPSDQGERISTRGWRLIGPEHEPTDLAAKAKYQIMTWVDEGETPKVRLDSFEATHPEASKIFDAYLNQGNSFRSTRTTAS